MHLFELEFDFMHLASVLKTASRRFARREQDNGRPFEYILVQDRQTERRIGYKNKFKQSLRLSSVAESFESFENDLPSISCRVSATESKVGGDEDAERENLTSSGRRNSGKISREVGLSEDRRRHDTTDTSETDDEGGMYGSLGVRSNIVGLVGKDHRDV